MALRPFDKIAEHHPDLVLLDLQMPAMAGWKWYVTYEAERTCP